MALTHHFCLGPSAQDATVYNFGSGVTLERTGVSAGDAGWAKYSGTAALDSTTLPLYLCESLDVAVPTSGSNYVWDIGYWYGRAVPAGSGTPNSTYKGVWKQYAQYDDSTNPIIKDNVELELRFINNGTTHEFQLVEIDKVYDIFGALQSTTTTVLGTTSGPYAHSTGRTVTIRVNEATSGGAKISVWIDLTLVFNEVALILTHANATPNVLYFIPITGSSAVNRLVIGPSTSAVDGYWSSWARFSSTASGDLVETTQYPEMHGHGPVGNGSNTAWTGAFGDWDDLYLTPFTDDNGATYCERGNTAGKESSNINTVTYTNGAVGATLMLFAAASVAAKSAPWSALLRENGGTEKEIALPSTAVTGYLLFNAGYATPPTGTWDAFLETGTSQMGADRTAAGDAVGLRVSSIWLEGFALGTTSKMPAAPPAVATGRSATYVF